MLNPEVWITGGTTMAVGMGIVFSFLVILVFAMLIMSNVVAWLNKVCPLPVAEVKQAKKATTDDSEIAVAIAVAMSQG
ncbi:MAG: OadG family protein [Candidatus Gastranaerophilales bacterium]|jgi:sodium pump decarboxylase gamma subunit|nr:OadG family protein [Candidatus Gastranaerophilales bacterium]